MPHVGAHLGGEGLQDLLRVGRPFVHDLARRAAPPSRSRPRRPRGMPRIDRQRHARWCLPHPPRRNKLNFPGWPSVERSMPPGRTSIMLISASRMARPITAVARSLLPSALNEPAGADLQTDRTVQDDEHGAAAGAGGGAMQQEFLLQHRGAGRERRPGNASAGSRGPCRFAQVSACYSLSALARSSTASCRSGGGKRG